MLEWRTDKTFWRRRKGCWGGEGQVLMGKSLHHPLVLQQPASRWCCHTFLCWIFGRRRRQSGSLSAAGTNSNPLIRGQTLQPPSCHCASGITLSLVPPPKLSSCCLWRPLPRKLKAVFKQRQERRENTARVGSVWKGRCTLSLFYSFFHPGLFILLNCNRHQSVWTFTHEQFSFDFRRNLS